MIWLSIFSTVCCLFSAITAQAGRSAFEGQIYGLIPSGGSLTEITPKDPIGESIDEALLKIFNTASGKIFCGASINHFETFYNTFFINKFSAQKAFALCKGRFAEKLTYKPFPKKYFVVFTPDEKYLADGWTTPRNETFLFFSITNYNRNRLAQSLIHELAMSYDRKELIGFGGIVGFAELPLKEDRNSCQLVQILTEDTTFKHTLSTIRAFEIEKRIAEEIGLKLPSGFANWGSLPCADRVRFIDPYVQSQSFQNSFLAESLFKTISSRPECPSARAEFKNSEERLKALTELTLNFTDGSTQNACEYMTQGWPYNVGTSFHGGPGPRVGGEGWIQLEEKEQTP